MPAAQAMTQNSRTPVRSSQARLVSCHHAAGDLLKATVELDGAVAHLREVQSLMSETRQVFADLLSERAAQAVNSLATTAGVDLDYPERLEGLDAAESADPVSDLVFMAVVQLRHDAGQLGGCTPATPANAVARIAHLCLRHVRKAAATVEPALAKAHGLTPRLSSTAQLESSLATRRAFTAFRLAVAEHGATASSLPPIAAVVRALVKSDVFQVVRADDRVELLRIERRLADALSATVNDLDASRLLADIRAFADMLSNVNQREELIQYDVQVLPQTITEVEALLAAGRPVLRGHLERVRGVDDRFERLVGSGGTLEASTIVIELRRILAERLRQPNSQSHTRG
jgi:DNA-directed RNA polymerase subunit F